MTYDKMLAGTLPFTGADEWPTTRAPCLPGA